MKVREYQYLLQKYSQKNTIMEFYSSFDCSVTRPLDRNGGGENGKMSNWCDSGAICRK